MSNANCEALRPPKFPNAKPAKLPSKQVAKRRRERAIRKSGITLCGPSRGRTDDLLVANETRFHCAMGPEFQPETDRLIDEKSLPKGGFPKQTSK